MAIKDLKNQFNKFLTAEINNIGKGFFIGPDDILYATVGGKDFIEAIKRGAEAICKAHDKTLLTYNTDAYWKTAIKQVSAQLKTENRLKVAGGATYNFASGVKYTITGGKVNLNSGVYVERLTSSTIELAIVTSTSDASRNIIKVEKVFDALKDAVWNKWVARLNKELGEDNVSIGGSTETTRGGRVRSTGAYQYVGESKRFGTLLSANIKRAHTGQTTTTVMALEKVGESLVPLTSLGVVLSPGDLVNDIRKGLKIDFGRERRKKKGVTSKQINFIEVRLARNVTEKSASGKGRDKRQILAAAEKYIKNRIEEGIENGTLDIGLDTKSSKSFKQAAIDDAINIVVEGLVKKNKRAKKVKITATKSPTINERGINLYKGKSGKSSKQKTQNINLAGKIATSAGSFSGRKRTQSGKLRDTRLTAAKLKSLINRSLPAEVRRNMGRPALINRTSRFSNSVVLKSLRDGPNTLIGEYTYQLDPYQTFENTGEKQWPVGYNPKPLITKSIKNLAARHVENKFTLRRV